MSDAGRNVVRPRKGLRWVQIAFIALLLRPFLALVLGLNIRRRELLPTSGPAIVVANHNSHLDTATILSLFPLSRVHLVRPVAAADYFMKSPLLAWFALTIMGILPIDRSAQRKTFDPLEESKAALDRGEILVLFPEGTRGEPEQLDRFKRGVAHLARARPEVPVCPLFLYGLGKALPKGTLLLVPFNCDLVLGEPISWATTKENGGTIPAFLDVLEARVSELAGEINRTSWE